MFVSFLLCPFSALGGILTYLFRVFRIRDLVDSSIYFFLTILLPFFSSFDHLSTLYFRGTIQNSKGQSREVTYTLQSSLPGSKVLFYALWHCILLVPEVDYARQIGSACSQSDR